VCFSILSMYVYIDTHTHTHTFMYIHIHKCAVWSWHLLKHLLVRLCFQNTCLCIFSYMYMRIYIYTYMHIHIYMFIYTHTCVYRENLREEERERIYTRWACIRHTPYNAHHTSYTIHYTPYICAHVRIQQHVLGVMDRMGVLEQIMTHTRTSHDAHMNESCHTHIMQHQRQPKTKTTRHSSRTNPPPMTTHPRPPAQMSPRPLRVP